ncbi:PRC-barrel domain-containing protein [Defluviicoccus vanus]|uniref:PRC-barrel domain-containing protein n=1 Tax=Defluviicoccus vanus TaxID=111831 RepID=A0A7H1N2M1_9PROT|nr:PRC-barrel domain-containing protein [Defluviicoccus vanus]QNT69957.1 PRC-barrel domain-containing protein [Defluviicoccus vanus]
MHSKLTRPLIVAAAALAVGGLVSTGPLLAQGTSQTVAIARIDIQKLATGFRASKLIGGTVVNHAGDKIGTLDDLILEPNANTPVAILSIGGFLGVGDHLVAVPFSSLTINKEKIVLPRATKEELKALPEFKYASS